MATDIKENIVRFDIPAKKYEHFGSGKVPKTGHPPTHPTLQPNIFLKWEVSGNVGLIMGGVGKQFPRILCWSSLDRQK